jgi:glutamate synthase (NADPH) large chain
MRFQTVANSGSLYTPTLEHDACGVGCIVDIKGRKSHRLVKDALQMLTSMEHRGATGSDPESGDGAGILLQIPHTFFKTELAEFGIPLPSEGSYGVGMVFFPPHHQLRERCRKLLNQAIRAYGFKLLGYRLVPVDKQVPGREAKAAEPYMEQVFVVPQDPTWRDDLLERKLYVLRNSISHQIKRTVIGENGDYYLASFSSRTIVYKGQLRTDQVARYFHDLRRPSLKSALALIHSRFSTNTFPNWKLAQPFRYIAHNGEINTIRGNVNKMVSKEACMQSKVFTDEELADLLPVTHPEYSDSANLDAMVELLTLSGRTMPHAMMMLVPEAWQDNKQMDPYLKAFYKYHASMMEPWDGPAALFFTNGHQIGACLDRNGLRPVRYCLTSDHRLIMASEVGVVPIDPKTVLQRGRLQPGKMLLADTLTGELLHDTEVKQRVYQNKPYYDWIIRERIKLRHLEIPSISTSKPAAQELLKMQGAYGFTEEEIATILHPMVATGKEPIGSMGADAPLAVLSRISQHPANYFKQYFAQVSNPPIDPIRERLVMSLFTRVGESLNILEESPAHTRQIHISQPVLSHGGFLKLTHMADMGFPTGFADATFLRMDNDGLRKGLDQLCQQALKAVEEGKKILVISNKKVSQSRVAIPSLLAIGAVHHFLVEQRLRTRLGLVVEAGDAWETHHFATLIGYGASAVYPFLAYHTIDTLYEKGKLDRSTPLEEFHEKYSEAVGLGLLKILSKMGISTLQSYQGAQIFECVGLGPEVIQRCFRGTVSRLDGLGFTSLQKECLIRHQAAFDSPKKLLEVGGYYRWRTQGEQHLLRPEIIHALQKSARLDDYALYKKYSAALREHQKGEITLRQLLEFKKRKPVSLEEVEPVANILKRFATGAMSFGSISHEAHATLAIAMNRIGGRSNSGEGGEDEARYLQKPNGDWERSAIKQVASGRFGVTSHYLSQAIELQIKVAQGAKPGEGGQLPGHKVDHWIARVRHSTPGVGLISPPPHHDIYSIEDLKQLIFDLKNANPRARINVKLVSEAGVGTIAAGVAKAKADAILISGADGGTGASPLSSIRHAGLPWEMGLAEAHQTLIKNNLRSRVVLQTDGKIMTGYDLAIATLLGAEEYGVSTAALIVEGCVMMRKCHLNTCPVGIATQNPELRKLFTGRPEDVVNLFRFLAMEMREIMAELGFRTIDEMVGQSHVLRVRTDTTHWKLKRLDLSPLLYQEAVPASVGTFHQIDQDHELGRVLDKKLERAFQQGESLAPVRIRNTDRAVGAMLSHRLSLRHGSKGLPDDSFRVEFHGAAGQSFGAFLAPGITFTLAGEANDYVGKGLSGGKLIIKPYETTRYTPEENILIGNVAFYGATSGRAYINGLAGERFCVRNSGMETVVEGIGDHGCEYMTGGKVLILGATGKNFGAGMSGGTAFVWDADHRFESQCNLEMIGLEAPDAEDFAWMHQRLTAHHAYTGSPLAMRMLAQWTTVQHQFKKVMPHDLKRVLAQHKLSTKKQVA